jgi:general secretion pathway protein E
VTDLELARASRAIPYGFARDMRVLLGTAEGDAAPPLWICSATPLAALAEVQRRFGRITPQVIEQPMLERAITRVYANEGGASARVAGEVEGSLELSQLMQELPELEDLLETEDDAPVVRLINALLTEAAR